MSRYFTIGMAGHIDHGKTTLTKALTGIHTDHLKEEQERKISIEPGFAPFILENDLEVAIIDVPGHERFIRQMIAGVAGIDLVILVIAADEGVMPQTREHLQILSLLGIQNGIVVMTKMDQADEELLEIVMEDVKEELVGTFLEEAAIYYVDSLSGKGVTKLKEALKDKMLKMTKEKIRTSFRLPIDHIFTVKGQGVVVRGTVYDGKVEEGDQLTLLPANKDVRVRQIQRHNERKTRASQGQRTAINIAGVSHEEVTRGDVLVADEFFSVSNRIDIVLHILEGIDYPVKQRQSIKLHIGTSEVMGRIIFFDRNEIEASADEEQIVCQLELEEDIVVTRGDRFIVRRPTPVETIGGGWVIEPNATKHRFGPKTIEELILKKEGSLEDRIALLLEKEMILTQSEIMNEESISEEEFNDVKQNLCQLDDQSFTLASIFDQIKDQIIHLIEQYHKDYPMRKGMDKAEVIASLQDYPAPIIEFALASLSEEETIRISKQFISLFHIRPTLPSEWETKLTEVEKELKRQNLEVEHWNAIVHEHKIPEQIHTDFYHYLIDHERAYVFDDDRLISKDAIDEAKMKLVKETERQNFNLQKAREVLQLTRKNLVPLLELFDELGYTKRIENERKWVT